MYWLYGNVDSLGLGRHPTKLAESSGVANSTITGLLKTLEKRGYCQRLPYVEDGRKVVVHLANDDREMMEKVSKLQVDTE